LLLGDISGDELDVDVRVEGLGQVLGDRVKSAATLGKFVVLLANVVVNNQELISANILLVHSVNGLLSISYLLKANVTVVLKSTSLVSVDLG
jgi:hypothetical protein